MEKLDEITISTLKEANVGEDLLSSLSRDDIKDLFPGPEHFLRRRALWLAVHKCEELVQLTSLTVRKPRKDTTRLQEIYKTKKPNKAAVTQLLNLEYESRRQLINSDAIKEQDRPVRVLEAYPCFRELDHVLDELQRIIQPSNSRYISEMKDIWESFYSKVQFYGVMKKIMKPPKTLDGVEDATAVFRALPLLFPSSTLPPKKLSICEAFFYVLKTSEDHEGYLRRRPLACPVLLVSEGNCMIAVGTTPVTTFDRKYLYEGLLYLMAYYYALHLTYPKYISTLLSILQTEILKDSIHDSDSTPSYKKALGEWKSFIE
ncbi:uncharacterized protein LOC143508162 [Brachyhypopomus gauderio]|uniref:uncharacterized protein LOC143508162 n=1 Tax=Brachyhypopomus gauderio TaxID=698409 RepID=UPI004042D788